MAHYGEWNDLVGRQVQIQRDGRTIRTGRVDAMTPAADAVWIAAHGAELPALYEKSQGHTFLPVFEHEGADHEHQG